MTYDLARNEEFCEKLEALVREYGPTVTDYDPENQNYCEHVNAPDWSSPLGLDHWALVVTVPDVEDTAFWLYIIKPHRQRSYITNGLLATAVEQL